MNYLSDLHAGCAGEHLVAADLGLWAALKSIGIKALTGEEFG